MLELSQKVFADLKCNWAVFVQSFESGRCDIRANHCLDVPVSAQSAKMALLQIWKFRLMVMHKTENSSCRNSPFFGGCLSWI